eukprot:1558394-Rhodomonas_salina.1
MSGIRTGCPSTRSTDKVAYPIQGIRRRPGTDAGYGATNSNTGTFVLHAVITDAVHRPLR